MAALSALPLSMGMQDLEDRAEREDARQSNGITTTNPSNPANTNYTAPSATPPNNTTNGGTPPLAHREYTAAFFHPRVLFVFVLGCLVPMIYVYLYVGAIWNPQSHVHRARIDIVNYDAGIDRSALIASSQLNATGAAALSRLVPTDNLGVLLAATLVYSNSSAALFDWFYYDTSNASYSSYDDLRMAVAEGDIDSWYSIVIPANYTQRYVDQALNLYNLTQLNGDLGQLVATNALPNPLTGTYNNPIYEVWDQGRSLATFSFLSAYLTAALNGLSAAITRQAYTAIATIPYGTALVKASFLLAPVPVASVNVHPVPYYGMNFFSYLAGLVLWIGSIVTLTVVVKWYRDNCTANNTLHTSTGVERAFFKSHSSYTHLHAGLGLLVRIILIALINIVQAALVMSVIPALGGSGLSVYGYSRLFVWLWYSAFCFSLTVGGLMALVGPEIFQLFATLWLILQLTSCGGIVDQVLQPGFYQIGRAFPLFYVVQGNRTILFGSYYRIEKDALVLFGWAVGSLIIIALLATRRIDKQWDALRDSALVDALRDTTGFSTTKHNAGIGTVSGAADGGSDAKGTAQDAAGNGKPALIHVRSVEQNVEMTTQRMADGSLQNGS